MRVDQFFRCILKAYSVIDGGRYGQLLIFFILRRIRSRTRSHLLKLIKITMQTYLQRKHYPAPSLALRPISDYTPHDFKCQCLMCNKFLHNKEKQLLSQQETEMVRGKSNLKRNYPQSQLEKVIKRLLIPTNKIIKRGVEIFIPQVCFFQDGEATSFFYNKDPSDYHLVKVKPEKITQTLLQKIFNQHRRNYRDRVKQLLKINIARQKSIRKGFNAKKMTFSKGDNLQAAVIRYTDGCESLYSETELLHLLQKRKTDPFWKKIFSIRNYIGPVSPNPEESQFVDINFDREKPSHWALWERANLLMQTYSTRNVKLDEGYISDEDELKFCQSLKSQSLSCLAIYTFYKAMAYLCQFSQEKVSSAKSKMFVNELGQCFLLQINHLKSTTLLKYNFTNDICKEMMKQQQFNKYHKKELNTTEKIIEQSSRIEELMMGQYQELKGRYGVSVEPKIDMNEKLNNQFFAHLYPDLPGDISDLLQKDMPFGTFRKKFLGQKPERRKLCTPFNSKFVRDLHKLTPRSRTTQDSTKSQIPVTPASARTSMTWRHRQSIKLSQTIST